MTEGGTNLSWFDLSEIIWINFFILKSRYRKCCVSVNFVRISHFLCVLCFFCVFFLCFEIFCVLGFFCVCVFLALCLWRVIMNSADYHAKESLFSACARCGESQQVW